MVVEEMYLFWTCGKNVLKWFLQYCLHYFALKAVNFVKCDICTRFRFKIIRSSYNTVDVKILFLFQTHSC